MKKNKNLIITVPLTYIITSSITNFTDDKLGLKNYNPFSNGINSKFVLSFALWMIIFFITYSIINSIFSNKTKESNNN